MQLKGVEAKELFTNLYYELTWPIGWEQILSMIKVITQNDFSKGTVLSLEKGELAGTEILDITDEFAKADYDIFNTKSALNEAGMLALAGRSSIMGNQMRFTFWNQTNRLLAQIWDTEAAEQDGGHAYDKYMDSIEISGHIEYALKHNKN